MNLKLNEIFKRTKELSILLLIIGVFVRIWQLGIVPGGLNQDEAFAGYEAYSLLHYGIDSSGYSFPVYFVSWGSGMNVLNSYLMMPFMAIFGAQDWVVRLPQVITACFSLYVFYLLLKKVFDEKIALVGLFFLVICPWHIMLSRWALESNLAPGFLLFGLYFFVLGVENTKYYMLSALFYGLSLYCYATIWPIVPLMLLLQAAYLLYMKKLKFDRNVLLAFLILAFLAMPLLFFMLINAGHMDEIRTAVLSIPKLPVMRDSEISLENMPENFKNLWNIISTQNDGLYWNTTSEYGLYYKGTLFFGILGLCYCLKGAFSGFLRREFNYQMFTIIPFACSLLLGGLINVNVNRINCIHIWIVLFIGVGLAKLFERFKADFKNIQIVVCTVFLVAFISFELFYFSTYRDGIGSMFQDGLGDAVETAEALAGEDGVINVSSEFSYSKVLFYSEMPATEYVETVDYVNYPAAYMSISSAGHYKFGVDTIYADGIYITNAANGPTFSEYGFTVNYYGNTAVAHK